MWDHSLHNAHANRSRMHAVCNIVSQTDIESVASFNAIGCTIFFLFFLANEILCRLLICLRCIHHCIMSIVYIHNYCLYFPSKCALLLVCCAPSSNCARNTQNTVLHPSRELSYENDTFEAFKVQFERHAYILMLKDVKCDFSVRKICMQPVQWCVCVAVSLCLHD